MDTDQQPTPTARICCITGGAGFIGSHLTERMLNEGFDVRVVDNLSSGRKSNLVSIAPEIEFLEGDVQDESFMAEATKGVDLMIHLAALGSVPRSVKDPLTSHQANATGTLNALQASRDAGVRRFIFASSSSVYGDHPALPKVEEQTGRLLSPYAVTKRMGEEYCRLFFQLYGVSTVALRFFNVFGPRQRADHAYAAVIPRFLDAALNDRPLPIYGDGLQSRDFTYVMNNVEGIVRTALADEQSVAGQVLNLACEGQVTLAQIIHMIEEAVGCNELAKEFQPTRPGDIRHSFADTSAIRKLTGFMPEVSVKQGIEATVEWFRDGCP